MAWLATWLGLGSAVLCCLTTAEVYLEYSSPRLQKYRMSRNWNRDAGKVDSLRLEIVEVVELRSQGST